MKGERFEMRVPAELLARLDEWRKLQPAPPTRAAAIRRFLEIGLEKSSIYRAVSKYVEDTDGIAL